MVSHRSTALKLLIAYAVHVALSGAIECPRRRTFVREFTPGLGSTSFADGTAVAGGLFFFAVQTAETGSVLWKSDGTEDGTSIVGDLQTGFDAAITLPLIPLGHRIFFVGDDGTHGRELWVSDGTETGTMMLRDIREGEIGASIQNLTVMGDRVFFVASDGSGAGSVLWSSDGTSAGTQALADPNPALEGESPDQLTPAGGLLYFTTHSRSASWLYRTDGTPESTLLLHTFDRDGIGRWGRWVNA